MPETTVVFFAYEGKVPLLEWLDDQSTKVQDKCLVRIERLAQMGFELHRPEADYLRDGIYELRSSYQRINYRMLYFFHMGKAVLSHGFTKEGEVPHKEIEKAIRNMKLFQGHPGKYTYKE
jgi:phage-related protein